MRKGKDPDPDPDRYGRYLWLMVPDPGRPKNMRVPNTARNQKISERSYMDHWNLTPKYRYLRSTVRVYKNTPW